MFPIAGNVDGDEEKEQHGKGESSAGTRNSPSLLQEPREKQESLRGLSTVAKLQQNSSLLT